MSEKHPAKVLAIRLECSEFPHMYAIPDACAMLRRIPALEAERDQLRAEVERLKAELDKAETDWLTP